MKPSLNTLAEGIVDINSLKQINIGFKYFNNKLKPLLAVIYLKVLNYPLIKRLVDTR